MKYKVKVYSIWEFGQRKDAAGNPHQEDSLFPAHNEATDKDRLFILCDGMGGHDAGEVASATVCEAMSNSVLSNVPDPEGRFTDGDLQRAIDDAFDALDRKDSGAVKKMGTTMTFLKLHDQGATIAHMGDSRVYHIRPGKDRDSTRILHVTSDHSLVNDLIKIGELTPEEAAHSRQKNVITRAMQPNMERRPRAELYHTADIRPGDYFYMCSDGMLEEMEDRYSYSDGERKEVGNEYLQFHFCADGKTDEEIVRRLTDATDGNRDNHTAIIVHVLEVSGAAPAEDERTVAGEQTLPRFMAVVEDDGPADSTGKGPAASSAGDGAGTPAACDKGKAPFAEKENSGSEGPDSVSYEDEEKLGSSWWRWIYWMGALLALLMVLYYARTHFPMPNPGGGGNVLPQDSNAVTSPAPGKPEKTSAGSSPDGEAGASSSSGTVAQPAATTDTTGGSGVGSPENASGNGVSAFLSNLGDQNSGRSGNGEERDVVNSDGAKVQNAANGALNSRTSSPSAGNN